MTINITQGDLLRQEVDAIINTVNCVGVMGKGIALQFKQKWPENFKHYAKACKDGDVKPGKMLVHELGRFGGKPYFIINFPTKDHWRGKSQLSFIEDGLDDLIRVIQAHGIRSIAMPPLGCGNGGLNWSVVKPIIEEKLRPLDNQLEIRLFEPKGAPDAASFVVRTERPKMTAGRAVLIKLLSAYRETGYLLSKIEVQKLCYFAHALGEMQKLNFKKHQFGPYADNLRHVLNDMSGHYISGVGDHDTADAQISLLEGSIEEADVFLGLHQESLERLESISKVIDGFETPYGMELLATVHWVAKNDVEVPTIENIVQGIYHWEPSKPAWGVRKQALMQEPHIKIALDRLKDTGWIQ